MWGYGDVGMWRCGDVVMWGYGDAGIWRCGDMVMRGSAFTLMKSGGRTDQR